MQQNDSPADGQAGWHPWFLVSEVATAELVFDPRSKWNVCDHAGDIPVGKHPEFAMSLCQLAPFVQSQRIATVP